MLAVEEEIQNITPGWTNNEKWLQKKQASILEINKYLEAMKYAHPSCQMSSPANKYQASNSWGPLLAFIYQIFRQEPQTRAVKCEMSWHDSYQAPWNINCPLSMAKSPEKLARLAPDGGESLPLQTWRWHLQDFGGNEEGGAGEINLCCFFLQPSVEIPRGLIL